ncbi:hypothetical protein NXF25_000163 [Crotalus adamanteus]|uniref:Titin-like n=1 Tax=Crotalus adamanteus TaxID=8729 RepID=A0AAW1C4M1_CROAD
MTADSNRDQFGDRDAQSISDDNQSLQDLNYIIDQLEREEMETLNGRSWSRNGVSHVRGCLLPVGSRMMGFGLKPAFSTALSLDIVSSQDEELKVDWEVSRTPSPDNTIAPDVSSQPYLLEADLNLSVDSVTSPPPPSLDSFFPCSLIEDSAFSIEKVLGPTTANILAEAEAEASKYADGLQSLEIEWTEDTNEPHRLLTCQICQLFVRTVDRLLDKSEQLMDHYLPLTEEEIANLKKAVEELDDSTTDHEMQVCFARISNLSGKLRQRAYMMALSKLRLARKNTEDNLAQLQQTIDLIGQVQRVDAMDYQKSFEKLTEISIQWSQRNSLQQQSVSLQTESFSPGQSIDEIGPRLAQSSEIEEMGVSISISSKEEAPVQGETPEMVPTFSAETEILPTEEVTPPPDVSSEKLPGPPEEAEPEAPPEEAEPEAPPEEAEPEAPPEEAEPEAPPEEAEPEAPPEEAEPEAPPEEAEPEAPPEAAEPEAPPEEAEPEAPPEEAEPEAPPEEVETEAPPEEVETEAPPEEVEPEAPPEEVEPEAPPEEVEPEAPPEEVEPEAPPEEAEPEAPPEEAEPEAPPEEAEPEAPPEEIEPEAPPEEIEPEVLPSPPEEVEPEVLPSPPEEVEPEVPPSPPEEVEPEKPPSPPEEVEPEKPPSPPAEVEPEKPPTPPPEVPKPPKKVALTPVAKEKVHRDVAHITLTSPGCDEDDLLLRMARSEEDIASEVETKTLEMSRSLTSNLKNTYESLLANLKDLPSNLQNKLYQTCRDMSELHSSFASAHCFSDLSSGLLNKSFAVMAEAQGSMDELMEFALQSPKALLWLKDYFPPILSRRQEAPDSMAEREAEEEMPPFDMRDIESNILKIQKAYDPGECYNGALFAKKEEAEEAPPSRESEDILKIQEAYEPQGCKEDATPSGDEKDVSPPSKDESKNWGIMKMLETYVPKISTIQGLLEKKNLPSSLQKEEEDAPAQEVEEALPSRDDILKLLRAYEPKGCEESSDLMEVATLGPKDVPLPSRADILKLLQAYEPQECHDDRLPSKEEKEETEAPRMPIKEAPSIKKVEFPPPVRKEDVIPPPVQKEEVVPPPFQVKVVPSLVQKEEVVPSPIQVDVVPSLVQKEEEVPPPVQVEVVPSLVQKEDEVPPSVQEDIPPLIQEEEFSLPVPYATQSNFISSRDNILKLEVNKSNNNNEVPPSAPEEEKQPPPEQPKNLLEIQKAHEPRECEDGSSIRTQAGEGSSSTPRERVDILKIQRAYDPKECEEMTPYREAEDASAAGSAASGRSEWSLFKLVQSYIPKSIKEEIFSKKEEDK